MANCNAAQDYIDKLKASLATATDDFQLAVKVEEQQLNLLGKKNSWLAFLQKISGQLEDTDQLAVTYAGVLERSVKQGTKVAGNAYMGIKATNILICQLKQVADCAEVLKILAGQLKDRITIPAKDGVVMTDIAALQKASEEAVAAIKAAIIATLTVYQAEEDLYKSLDGGDTQDKGIVKHLTWMREQVLFGYNPDVELNCTDNDGNCTKHSTPLFPVAAGNTFYKELKKKLETLPGEIETLATKATKDTCERETKQARQDALKAALSAAEAAKSCEIKK
jgi:hypothetical protein